MVTWWIVAFLPSVKLSFKSIDGFAMLDLDVGHLKHV